MADEKITQAVFKERLSAIATNMETGFDRLEKAVMSLELRIRTLETSAFADIAIQKSKIEALNDRADENKLNIKTIEAELEKFPKYEDVKEVVDAHPQVMAYLGIVKWILGVFGLLVIGLLWAIFTHSVNIVVNP